MAVFQASGNDNQILPSCCLCFILLTSLFSRLLPHSLRCHQQLEAFPSWVPSNNSLCDSSNEILVASLIDHVWLILSAEVRGGSKPCPAPQMLSQRQRDALSTEVGILSKKSNRSLGDGNISKFSPMNECYIVYVAMSSGVMQLNGLALGFS